MRRPRARFVVALAMLLLLALAIARHPIRPEKERVYPEVTVIVSLPRTEPLADVTASYLLPLESAARSMPQFLGMTGEIGDRFFWETIRFRAEADPVDKAVVLRRSLGKLAHKLGTGGEVSVYPAVASDAADLQLVSEGAMEERNAGRLATLLADISGVESVSVKGASRAELAHRIDDARQISPAELAGQLRSRLTPRSLGRFAISGHLLPVVAGSNELPTWLTPVVSGKSVLPLAQVAVGERRMRPGSTIIHVGGKRSVLFSVRFKRSESLLRTATVFRRKALALFRKEGLSPRTMDERSVPVRRLVSVSILVVLLAAMVMALYSGNGLRGSLVGVAAMPVALSSAWNGVLFSQQRIDAGMLPLMLVAVAAALPMAGWRALRQPPSALTTLLLGFLSPVVAMLAVALPAGSFDPILRETAFFFGTCYVAAALALHLVWHKPHGGGQAAKILRWSYRDPATVVLFSVVLIYLLAVMCGGALYPRAGRVRESSRRVEGRLAYSPDSTIEDTEATVGRVERIAAMIPGTRCLQSEIQPGTARLVIEIGRQALRKGGIRGVIGRLSKKAHNVGAEIDFTRNGRRIGPVLSPLPELEERPEVAENAAFYRFILRSSDPDTLVESFGRLLERFREIQPEWGRPRTRMRLYARNGEADPTELLIARLADKEQSITPFFEAPRIVVRWGRRRERESPQLQSVLGEALTSGTTTLVPEQLVDLQAEVVPPRLRRINGSFVLPIDFRPRVVSRAGRWRSVRAFHQSLTTVRLPAGAAIERPRLRHAFMRENVAILGMLLLCPLLVFLAAVVWTNSFAYGGVCLLSVAAGPIFAAPLFRLGLAVPDGRSWATLLCAATTLMAPALLMMGSLQAAAMRSYAPRPRLPRRLLFDRLAVWVYRGERRLAPMLLAGFYLWCGVLLLCAFQRLDQNAWLSPVRAAAASLAGGYLMLLLFVPHLVVARERRRLSLALAASEGDGGEPGRRIQKPSSMASPGTPLLSVRSLTKVYTGGVKALNGVSFELGPGIVGLLGPNGAGKTTLIRLLATLLTPTRGQIHYRGVPLGARSQSDYRRRIGLLPQEFNAYEEFDCRGFLKYFAAIRKLGSRAAIDQEIERVLGQVELLDAANRRVRHLSGGMRRRLGVAQALMGSPEFLIVDEPTTGLDIESRARLQQVLLKLAASRIVLLSTHIASDIEAVAPRLLVLDRGRLLFDGSPALLITSARGRVFERTAPDAAIEELSKRFRLTARVRVVDGVRARGVVAEGDSLPGEACEPSLEEAYLVCIGEVAPMTLNLPEIPR